MARKGNETPDDELPPLVPDELVQRCMGNIDFASRILRKFADRFSEDLVDLEEGIAAKDCDGVARTAHRLKGTSANASAVHLRAIAEELEDLARCGELEPLSKCVDDLVSAWDEFVGYTATEMKAGT